jgi:CheY-like chemotaxis protein
MKHIRVWIVEDNHADAFLIEMALQRTGLQYEKTLMRDGESAIERIRACQAGAVPLPDVLLLDISLPRFDGSEVLRVLRETSLFDGVGIAILSSSPMIDGRFGVKRYLQKPSTLEQFLERVSRTVTELLPVQRAAHIPT